MPFWHSPLTPRTLRDLRLRSEIALQDAVMAHRGAAIRAQEPKGVRGHLEAVRAGEQAAVLTPGAAAGPTGPLRRSARTF